VVEHLPNHPKVEGSCLATAVGIGRSVKLVKNNKLQVRKVLCHRSLAEQPWPCIDGYGDDEGMGLQEAGSVTTCGKYYKTF
jgi:hypothetical protein